MLWFLGVILLLGGILLLPLRARLTLSYGAKGLCGGVALLIWKKEIFKKEYQEDVVADLLAKKTQEEQAKTKKSRLQRKIAEAVKENWSSIVSIAARDITIEEWTLLGAMSADFPAAKGVFYGVISGVTWWFYGASRRWLIWKKQPVLHLGFSSADTNWQWQCMIKTSPGQIIGKGMKLVMCIRKRRVKNGAKERNRNAHANGYF